MDSGFSVSDQELLHRYAGLGDQRAFAQIVGRHGGLVQGVARRQLRGAAAADDVAQAVFVILARKAGRVAGERTLSRWLVATTCYVTAGVRRSESRRTRREAAGSCERACSADPAEVLLWRDLAQHVDRAVLRLAAVDQRLVLLRYFEGRSVAEAAVAVDLTEGAAKQRLSRALEKLRVRLQRFDPAAGPVEVAVFTRWFETQAHLPTTANLLANIGQATRGGATANNGIRLAQGAMKMMNLAKIKMGVAAALVVAAAGTGALVEVRHSWAGAADVPSPAAITRAENAAALQRFPPVVVRTFPAAGAADVDPATGEIAVTFSNPMSAGSYSWGYGGDHSQFPKLAGNSHYRDDHTAVLPVRLEAGHLYALWINSDSLNNFKDTQGKPSVPYLLTFATNSGVASNANRSEAFDRAMSAYANRDNAAAAAAFAEVDSADPNYATAQRLWGTTSAAKSWRSGIKPSSTWTTR